MFEKLKKEKYFISLLIIFGYLLPLMFSLGNVLSGNFAFWFDPARDLFLALKNLSKPSLIGPPSGIPGFFYGPYWIWLISIIMFFSKDPRLITLFVSIIPYFIIFPLILLQFRKLFCLKIILLIWIVFILNFGGYATQLWNPNLAPLLFLSVVYLTTFTDFYQKQTNYLKLLLLGILAGLLFNFHISFGIGLAFGIIIFFLLHWKNLKFKTIVMALIFIAGFLLTLLPFAAFEYRHGFQQIKVAINTLTSPVSVVGQKGMGQFEIIKQFFGRLSDAFRLPKMVATILGLTAFGYLFYFLKIKKFDLKNPLIKLLLFLSIVSFSLLFIYLTSKNPVWNYHFISVEIIFLLILAFLADRFSILEKFLIFYVVILIVLNIITFADYHPERIISLATKERIVKLVINDAKSKKYTVFIYNPAIYNYDFAYLFQARGKDVHYDPGETPSGADLVYLIIDQGSQAEKGDFIHYRTPDKVYKTVKTWQTEDGSIIIKRSKQ